MILPPILLWFIGRPAQHIGASGWVYVLVFFIFFSGILRMQVKLLGQSLLVAFVYGSLFWGLLPHDPGISWEGHAAGAIIGLAMAILFRSEPPHESLEDPKFPDLDEEVDWEDWKEIDQDPRDPTQHRP